MGSLLRSRIACVLGSIVWLAACGGGTPAVDGGSADAGPGGVDAGPGDSGPGDVDASVDAGPEPGAPTCTIMAPVDGAEVPFDEMVTFVATASDPEDGPLTGASIVWTTDRDAADLGTGESLMVTLPTSGDHVITCTATDSEGNTGASSITITSVSPRAEIWHPGDGETRPAASAIPFTGRGFDLEDGALPASALVWTSDLDGVLDTSGGTPENFSATLSAGTNVVTLTVTDSMGNTASASITLTITP